MRTTPLCGEETTPSTPRTAASPPPNILQGAFRAVQHRLSGPQPKQGADILKRPGGFKTKQNKLFERGPRHFMILLDVISVLKYSRICLVVTAFKGFLILSGFTSQSSLYDGVYVIDRPTQSSALLLRKTNYTFFLFFVFFTNRSEMCDVHFCPAPLNGCSHSSKPL